jgi:formate dehydrogenase
MVLYPGNGHKVEFGELEGQPVPGSAEGDIGLRRWLEDERHELITTTDREGGELEQNLADADVLITTPFWPVYVTRELIENASRLKLIPPPGSAATMWTWRRG